MSADVNHLAHRVRDEAERLAHEHGYASLEGWCGIVSGALTRVLLDAGLHAEIAGGWFVIDDYEEGHFWVLVGPPAPFEQWPSYATILDLTATQYPIADVPRVVRLDAGDERRRMYMLRELGFEECFDENARVHRLTSVSRSTASSSGMSLQGAA